VLAPLIADSNAEAAIAAAGTYQMSWDYTEGDTPDAVKYSIDPYTSYTPRSIAMILNATSFVLEPWTGPSTNGPVIRKNSGHEANPYRDVDMSGVAEAIDAAYETAIVPGEDASFQATVHDFHGAHFRVQGVGDMTIRADGIDNIRSVTPVRSPLALSTTPGVEELVKWFLRTEQQTIRFGNANVDEYFTVLMIRAYHTNAMPIR